MNPSAPDLASPGLTSPDLASPGPASPGPASTGGPDAADDESRARAVFDELLEVPDAAGRARRLAAVRCGGAPNVADRAAALLAAHVAAGRFLAAPTVVPPAGPARDTPPAAPGDPGRHVGPYELLGPIGEGGFGTVYAAEQARPVRRTVALKVIKPGMDTRQVIARFEAERQALAMMDHPGIARVFDAGATDAGRPYFVMELVRGSPITRYCDDRRADVPARLRLFAQVCAAVQHAHQKGVIHRDLKPSNVLVAEVDGRPVPKVIDFGIAKATAARLTDRTLHTEFPQMVGTPEYMSPEQADPAGADVDTRTDVYALGVLLYELLVGATPFDGRALRAGAAAEMRRVIREVDPPRPSTRLAAAARDGALAAVAAARQAQPAQLARRLRGELDWVVMRCLEKDRDRRYESAAALAADVERYLGHAPVTARPAGAWYLFRKAVRRHRAAFATAAAVAAALVLGVAGTTHGLMRAKGERDAARRAGLAEAAERRAAEAARAQAEAVSRFLQDMLGAANPLRAQGKPVLVRDVVDAAAKRVDAGALAGQPLVEAAVRRTLAQMYNEVGPLPEATRHARLSLDLFRRAHGDDHPDVGRAMMMLSGFLLNPGGDRAESVRLAGQAIPVLRRHLQDRPGELASHLSNRSRTLPPADAEAALREALTLLDRAAADPQAKGLRAHVLNNLVGGMMARGDLAGAEATQRQAVDLIREAAGEVHQSHAWFLESLAGIRKERGDPAEAVAMLRRVVEIRRQVFGDEHHHVARGLEFLSEALTQAGDRPAAAAAFREASRIQLKLDAGLLEQTPDHPGRLASRGAWRARLGDFAAARADLDRYVEVDPGAPPLAWFRRAVVRLMAGDEAGYRDACEAALRRFAAATDPSAAGMTAKACLVRPGAVADAAALDRLVARVRGPTEAGKYPWGRLTLGMAAYRAGRFDEAIGWLEGDAAAATAGGVMAATRDAYAALAHHAAGRPARARALLDRAAATIRDVVPRPGEDDLGRQFENWVVMRLAFREAEARVGPAAATGPATRPAE